MKRLLCLLLSLLTVIPACAQLAKEKPAEAKPSAETIVGVWYGNTAGFDEYMTFTADGRMFLQRGPGETLTGTYKVDASARPWKLDLTTRMEGTSFNSYGLFDLPAPDRFRMTRLSPYEKERPDAKALQESKLSLQRISLGAHGGIYQVVEAHLKRLTGTWEGKQGKISASITLGADGSYTIKTDELTDKGRFRIDVSKVPCALDLLSGEGLGPKYGLYEITAEGELRLSRSSRKAEDRPKNFESPGTQDFRKREAAPR